MSELALVSPGSVTLDTAFSVRVGVALDVGSVGYTSSATHNYNFRIFLSRESDKVSPDSEEGYLIVFCEFLHTISMASQTQINIDPCPILWFSFKRYCKCMVSPKNHVGALCIDNHLSPPLRSVLERRLLGPAAARRCRRQHDAQLQRGDDAARRARHQILWRQLPAGCAR